jgi:hypothetical protein
MPFPFGSVSFGLLLATSIPLTAHAAGSFAAHRTKLLKRIAELDRTGRATKLSFATEFAHETQRLLFAARAYNAMYAAPDAGIEIARNGETRLELGTTRIVKRGKDGVPRPAALRDLAAAGITTNGELHAALASGITADLAKRGFRVSDEASLIETMERAVAQGASQVAALATHPDIGRLRAQRGKRGRLELLDSSSDLSIMLEKDGTLGARFGAARRTPTIGQLAWLGLTSDKAVSRLLGRRLLEGAQPPKSRSRRCARRWMRRSSSSRLRKRCRCSCSRMRCCNRRSSLRNRPLSSVC